MFFKSVILLLIFNINSAIAVTPGQRVEEFISYMKGINIGENSKKISNSQIEKNKIFARKAISIVNINKILKISLGSTWNKIGEEKQKRVHEVLKRLIVLNAFPRTSQFLSEYPYKLNSSKINKKGQASVRKIVLIKGDDENPEDTEMLIDYFLDKKNNNWYITNFSVDGIETVETFTNQFSNIIQNKGFDKLLSLMEKKKEGLTEEYGAAIPE